VLNPPSMYQKIADMGRQNQKDREKYTSLRDQMKLFEGVDDLAGWKKAADEAIATVENMNDKDFMDASKVATLKQEINQAWEEKLRRKDAAISDIEKTYTEAIAERDSKIRYLLVSNQFASSRFFTGEKPVTWFPPAEAEKVFGHHFKVEEEDGKTVVRAYHTNGDLIRSKENPGEPAGFDEAMGFILDAHPNKERFIRGTTGGSGATGGSGTGDSEKSEVKKLEKQLADAQAKGNVKLSITLKNRLHEARRKSAA
jgi:hypothetical protein